MDATKAEALESLIGIFPKVDYRILRAAVKEATAGASVAQIVDEVVDFISESSSSASEDGELASDSVNVSTCLLLRPKNDVSRSFP